MWTGHEGGGPCRFVILYHSLPTASQTDEYQCASHIRVLARLVQRTLLQDLTRCHILPRAAWITRIILGYRLINRITYLDTLLESCIIRNYVTQTNESTTYNSTASAHLKASAIRHRNSCIQWMFPLCCVKKSLCRVVGITCSIRICPSLQMPLKNDAEHQCAWFGLN